MKPKVKFLRNTPEEERAINAGIVADPDTYVPTEEEFKRFKPLFPRGRPKSEKPKISITVRLDGAIVEFFRSGGDGWQTRLNALLAAHVKRAGKRKPAKPKGKAVGVSRRKAAA
jgi:uncharacterized protein (DUF4415 family)